MTVIMTVQSLRVVIIHNTGEPWFMHMMPATRYQQLTSTKLIYAEPGEYWNWWLPMAGLSSRYSSRPLSLAIFPRLSAHKYRQWFRSPLGKNSNFCIAVRSVTRTSGILAYFNLASLGITLIGTKVKGDELPCDGPHSQQITDKKAINSKYAKLTVNIP